MSKPQIPFMTMYGWCGEDRVGTFGVSTVLTTFGASAAIFGKRELAEQYRDQMQARANDLGKPVYLIEFVSRTDTESPRPLDTIHPHDPEEN